MKTLKEVRESLSPERQAKIQERYDALVDELREIVAENERLRARLAEAERLLTTCCGAVDDALQDTIDEYFAGRETTND